MKNKISLALLSSFLACGVEPSKEINGNPPSINEAPKEEVETDPESQNTDSTTSDSLEQRVFTVFNSDPGNSDSLLNQREPYGNRLLSEIAVDNSIRYTGFGFSALYFTQNGDGQRVRDSLYTDLQSNVELTRTELDSIIINLNDNSDTLIYLNQLTGDDQVQRDYFLVFTTQSPIYGNQKTQSIAYLTLIPTAYQIIKEISDRETSDAFNNPQ